MKEPSSHPVTNNVGTFLFQDKTLTSVSWALILVCAFDLLLSLKSHNYKVPSIEQEAISQSSTGENSISSIDPSWKV